MSWEGAIPGMWGQYSLLSVKMNNHSVFTPDRLLLHESNITITINCRLADPDR